MACSSEVNGPDSTTSVDSVPISATRNSAQNAVVRPNTSPAAESPMNNTAYSRRRPIRLANRPTTIDVMAVPARTAASRALTCVPDQPRASSEAPSSTDVIPYPNARIDCAARILRPSGDRPGSFVSVPVTRPLSFARGRFVRRRFGLVSARGLAAAPRVEGLVHELPAFQQPVVVGLDVQPAHADRL